MLPCNLWPMPFENSFWTLWPTCKHWRHHSLSVICTAFRSPWQFRSTWYFPPVPVRNKWVALSWMAIYLSSRPFPFEDELWDDDIGMDKGVGNGTSASCLSSFLPFPFTWFLLLAWSLDSPPWPFPAWSGWGCGANLRHRHGRSKVTKMTKRV